MNTPVASTIDVRLIPPAARHGLIFERLAGLDPQDALQLVSDHDPVPLRRQLDQQWPDRFAFAYLDSSPDLWRLEIRRAPATAEKAREGSCCSGGACCG
jgi:uncharacterized protein (DUF2249 family)